MNINDIRNKIDEIDDQITKLFLQRMEYSKMIGHTKKLNGIKIFDPSREKEILNRVTKKSSVYKNVIEDLFLTILKLSKDVQGEEM